MTDPLTLPQPASRQWHVPGLLGLLLLMAAFVGVALSQVSRQGFWHDEIYTLSFLRGLDIYLFAGCDLPANTLHPVQWYQQALQQDTYWPHFWRNIVHEGHPPLYYLLLKGWSYLAGTSEAGLRGFSILAATLSLLVAYQAGALLSRRAALLFTGLLACCPLFLFYALEARMYALYVLLALVCFYLFLKLSLPAARPSARTLGWFVVAGIVLVYTHYYGVFFYGVLALSLALRFYQQKAWGRLASLALPGVALLLWVPIIRQQTAAHQEHWTNGYEGFGHSLKQFAKGSAELLTAPYLSQHSTGFYVIYALLLGLLLNLRWREARLRGQLLTIGVLIAAYGVGIIIFDKVLNHHTIAVPRYYIPLLFVALFVVVLLVENGRSRLLGWVAAGALLVVFGKIQINIFTQRREAKQMYREAASYLSQHYDPASVELVISPNGPSAVGVAYYARKNFTVRALPVAKVCDEYAKAHVVVVEQHLGVTGEPWAQPCKSPAVEARLTRFVCVDVVNAK